MGNSRAVAQGLKEAPVQVREYVQGILSEVSCIQIHHNAMLSESNEICSS